MRQVTRLVSTVVVYFADTDFDGVMGALEAEFMTKLEISEHKLVGDTGACIIDVRVPDAFALHAVQQRLGRAMPTVGIKMMERFPGSWWAHHRWSIAIGIGVGLAVALMVELLRPLIARLRDVPG